MAETIVETHNLFIDSSQANQENGSNGADYSFVLSNAGIHAKSGQQIRLTLNNFTLVRTWSSINTSNQTFYLCTIVNATINGNTVQVVKGAKCTIASGNYETIKDLTTEVERVLNDAIESESGDGEALKPLAGYKFVANEENEESKTGKIHLKLTKTSGDPIDPGDLPPDIFIQTFYEDSDSYVILGSRRINGAAPPDDLTSHTFQEINCFDVNNTAQTDDNSVYYFEVSSPYGAILHSFPYVYLRTNTASYSYSSGTLNAKNSTSSTNLGLQTSNILAKIELNGEYFHYEAGVEREYSIRLQQHTLPEIRLRLTDHRDNGLPYEPGQSTDGNAFFSAVIRVDILQGPLANKLESEPYHPQIHDRFLSHPLEKIDLGRAFYQQKRG